jgi:hypothetical protein
MVRAQTLRDFHQSRVFPVRNGVVGYVATSDRFSAIPMFRQSPDGDLLMVGGVPIDHHGTLEQTLQRISSQDCLEAARSLASLDGAFAALFWDNGCGKIAVVTDFLGIQPLYVVRREGLLLLASDLKGIAASGLVDLDMDPASWGAFISLGHFLGDDTSLKAVKRVGAGSIILYDPSRGSLETSKYWEWPEAKPIRKMEDVDTGYLLDLLRQDIKGYSDHNPNGTLLLSGGLDSRLLLALLKQEGLYHQALILAHPDEFFGADGEFAVRAATLLQANYELVRSPRSCYSSPAYLDYLMMNEVAFPSLYLFIAQVSGHIRADMHAIWEGHAPGCTVNLWAQPPGGFGPYLQSCCAPPTSPWWRAARQIFAQPTFEQIREEFRLSLDREKSKYPDDEFGVLGFRIACRVRNRSSSNPTKVYANDVLPFTPGFSRDFINYVASIPLSLKLGRKLYLKIYRDHFPKAANVPFCSGPVLVNPWRRSDLRHYLTAAELAVRRSYSNRYLRGGLRRLHSALFSWDPSTWVNRVIKHVNPDHPDLNGAEVRLLQREQYPARHPARTSQELLFYWQVWRWVMDGSLGVRMKDDESPQGRSTI